MYNQTSFRIQLLADSNTWSKRANKKRHRPLVQYRGEIKAKGTSVQDLNSMNALIKSSSRRDKTILKTSPYSWKNLRVPRSEKLITKLIY